MKSHLIITIITCLATSAFGQFTVGEGIRLQIDNTVATNGTVHNEGAILWTSNSLLFLNGEGEFLSKEGATISNLKVKGAYQLIRSLKVSNTLNLVGGVLTPQNNVQLILQPDVDVNVEDEGYINGSLYQEGTGEKFYPLGKNGIYTPVILNNVQGDEDVIVKIEAFNESLDIGESGPNWFWEIQHDGNFEGSIIQLPILDAGGEVFTILQSDGTSNTNLGGNLINDFTSIESEQVATGPYVLLGTNREGDSPLTIHNIVTPDREDGKNDAFYIENIERYMENTVILMDRWGTEVCRMENFSNDPAAQKGCDLQRLPAGNYICVVKHNGIKSKPVLITILK